jgi:hypothetical protein
LKIEIDGRFYQTLIDSGASVSVINTEIVASEIRKTQIIARGITGNILKIMGTQVVTFNVGKRIFTNEV